MEQFKQVSLTWFRAAGAAAIALYLAGETNLKVLGTAALAGLLGPALKWLDPSAKEFGRGAEKTPAVKKYLDERGLFLFVL
jgi:hypothetical protein